MYKEFCISKHYLNLNNLVESDYYSSFALRAYNRALYSASRLWRFSNIYAGPMWLYLVSFLIAVLGFYWYQLDKNVLSLPVGIEETALHATTWGTIGGILRGLWFLKDKVSDRKYRNSFRIYFLSIPFLGGLFGAILYFILLAGVFILVPSQAPNTIESTQSASTSLNLLPTLDIIPLATLAGFNWEWAVMIFKRIGDSFKEVVEPEAKIEK